MVQLNPFKWGSKNRKKKKDQLRIGEIDESLKKNRRSQGGAGQKRRKLKQERAELAGTAEKKKEKAPRKTGRGQGNRKIAGNPNRGGGKTSTSTSKSSSKSTSTDKAAWLKKTRNSPAAKSGAFTPDERWAIYQRSQKKKKK